MRRVKVRTYSGVVCEQEVFDISDKLDVRTARPRRPRFATPEEREQHKLEISRRKHTRLFNANFGPTSLYSTLTLSDEYEVHTFEEAKRLRDNFIRRLQYAYPDVRIMAYLGRGKATRASTCTWCPRGCRRSTSASNGIWAAWCASSICGALLL